MPKKNFGDVEEIPVKEEEKPIWNGMDYPQRDDTFWYIDRKLEVRPDYATSHHRIREYCSSGNCFKTEADAEARRQLLLELFDPIDIPVEAVKYEME